MRKARHLQIQLLLSPYMEGQTTFIIESTALTKTLAQLFPDWQAEGRLLDWHKWVAHLSPHPTVEPPDRDKLFAELCGHDTKVDLKRTLLTLEHLREALIFTEEDVEFCFSQLPDTARFQQLQQWLLSYLNSDLRLDWTHQVWEIIEFLKSGHQIKNLFPPICFVRSSPQNALFAETYQAFQFAWGPEQVSMKNPWDLALNDASQIRRTLALHGDTESLIQRLAKKIKTLLTKGTSASNIKIFFRGSTTQRRYLKFNLAHLKCGVNDWTEEHTSDRDEASVDLLPFFPMPSAPLGTQILYFQSEETPTQEVNTILTAREQELFRQQGFPLPSSESPHQNWEGFENAFLYGHHQRPLLFSSQKTSTSYHCQRQIDPPSTAQKVPSTLPPPSHVRLSATQLETYAQCPSKHFFTHRLRLRKPETDWEERYALLFGNAVHLALEKYLRDGKEHPLTLESCFESALPLVQPGMQQEGTLATLLKNDFQKRIPLFKKLEAHIPNLFPKSQPTYFERAFEMEFEGVRVRGKIDRLDQLPNGDWILYDYKTGKVDFSPKHIQDGKHFQALLYFIATETLSKGSVVAVLFYDLKSGELKRGLVRDDSLPPQVKKSFTRGHTLTGEAFEAIIEAGKSHIRTLSKQIQSGNIKPNPDPKHCQYCEYTAFCRKAPGYV